LWRIKRGVWRSPETGEVIGEADVGHHDAYSMPRGILFGCARRLAGLPVLFVGVRCPLAVILERRRSTGYLATGSTDTEVPILVQRWQEAVHRPGMYDLEVDTSLLTPAACAERIRHHLATGLQPSVFQRLAALAPPPEI
jgi:chloramphenicol 3-O phosphotransferase